MSDHNPDVTHITPSDGSTPYWLICEDDGFEAKLPACRYSIETVMDIVRLITVAKRSGVPNPIAVTPIQPCDSQGAH